jgi:short subunit dehydrogenase-like uncharacterized protein
MSDDRALDIQLFGATSFVGRLTAEYLARAAPEDVRIGLSGRSQDKLESLRASLPAAAAQWPITVADCTDAAAMQDLARNARVVVTTVGPYRQYGLLLVEACATAGTHYADLTGEVLFMRETIDRFDDTARQSGARIVHSCGFDSIPSDIGVLLAHEAAQAGGDGELTEVTLMVRTLRGGMSGGTIASMKDGLDQAKADRRSRRLMGDPYALSPDREAEPDLGDESDLRGVLRDDELGAWIGPFVMAQINTRVVRRSNALQDYAYGRALRYREVMSFGTDNIVAPVKAAGMAAGVTALAGGLMFGPTRAILDRVLPDPGDGPDEKTRTNGGFDIEIHARTSGGKRYVTHVAAQGDPGYAATAVMLGESGLALALDDSALPARAGVLTPATALGDRLAERLRAAGQTYDVSAR